jgi:hypothetical protein
MAKKKSVKKKSSSKKSKLTSKKSKTISKRPAKNSKKRNVSKPTRVVKKSISKKTIKTSPVVRASKRKINLVSKKLIFFIALALICFLLYLFLVNEMFNNLFLVLTILFSFVSVGFFIVLLVFLILRLIKKR